MRLWLIAEGIYLSSPANVGPQTLAGADKAKEFMRPEYLYRAEDHPEDIVHMQPLNDVKTLPFLPSDRNALPNFEGIKLYYAYAVVPSDTFEEPSNPEEKDYSELVDASAHLVHKDEPREEVEYAQREANKASVMARRGSSERKQTEAEEDYDILTQVLQAMDEMGAETVADLKTDAGQDYGVYKHKYLFHATQSLAKKIKKPSTKDEERMSKEILDGAIRNLTRIHKEPFDIIAYPQSKSDFNKRMISSLIDVYGSKPIEISKLSGDETEVNWEAIYELAQRHHKEALSGVKQRGMGGLKIDPERRSKITSSQYFDLSELPEVGLNETLITRDPRWPEWWMAQLVAQVDAATKASGANAITAKALQSLGHHKRYLQMFAKPAESLEGKRILVVDDNIAYGGTMEIIHDLVQKQHPKEVMIFSPFYMGTVKDAYS